MTQKSPESDSRIGVSHVDGDGNLVLQVALGTESSLHQLSLAQARALSLEIIKQVYRSEQRQGLHAKSLGGQALSFDFRQRDHAMK